MKKSLLVAASMVATLTGVSVLESAKASPQFQVTAATPGTISFSGSGTAQFNNSTGTNNSFQVGSSTNLGVNASTSSTAEYGVTGQAKLDLAGTTTLQQVIGTSGASNSKANTASRAHDVARDVMSSWSGGSSWEYGNSNYGSQAEWQAAYDAEYSSAYNNTYSTMRGTESSSDTTGTISGVFKTKETGSARNSSSMADWQAAASASAERSYGASYDPTNSSYSFESEGEWQAAYDAEYNRAYGSAAAGATRSSESEVTVNGIGSDASVQAADSSTFAVDIAQNSGMSFGSTATANGSAGASLATSSFANQSQSSTASGFMQAFGGN
jgi:hypothetical protein